VGVRQVREGNTDVEKEFGKYSMRQKKEGKRRSE